jgi:bile acid:Na+ symporter, BASS family
MESGTLRRVLASMDLKGILTLAINASIALMVFSFGLRASLHETAAYFSRPRRVFRDVLSMNVVMPLVAVFLAATFHLHPAIKIALVALAISPVPPFLPAKELKAGATAGQVFGLLSSSAILSIVIVPMSLLLIGKYFGLPLGMRPGAVARLVLNTVLLPLVAGMIVRSLWPAFASRIVRPTTIVAAAVLVLSLVPVLFAVWRPIVSLIGNGNVLVIAVFVAIGLGVGHVLGGPDEGQRTALAFSTATRHPAIAMAIARANFPNEKLAPAAILLYLLVCTIVSIPYKGRRQKRHAKAAAPEAAEAHEAQPV